MRFIAASSHRRQNFKYKNFTPSFDRLRQNITSKSVTHAQHDYFSTFNQSKHCFVALSLPFLLANLKHPIAERARCNWTVRSTVVNTENERFTVVCSSRR